MNVGKIGSMLTEQFTNQCHLGATFQDVLWAMVKKMIFKLWCRSGPFWILMSG